MNNVFAGYLDIHRRYDLKGSTFHRFASEKERAKLHCVYKDQDLLHHITSSTPMLQFGREVGEMIQRDAAFLMRAKLIDYSLLVGIHFKTESLRPPNSEPVPEYQTHLYDLHDHRKAHQGSTYVETPHYVAYLGIVDILTIYKTKKRLETTFTGTLLNRDVSCKPPSSYGTRFIRFLFKHVDLSSEVATMK